MVMDLSTHVYQDQNSHYSKDKWRITSGQIATYKPSKYLDIPFINLACDKKNQDSKLLFMDSLYLTNANFALDAL